MFASFGSDKLVWIPLNSGSILSIQSGMDLCVNEVITVKGVSIGVL